MEDSQSNGLSIIVCSLNSNYANDLKVNIEETSGLNCEFIIIKNTGNLPIAKIYNKGASIATNPYLLLIHEDVRWLSSDWGIKIISKLKESSTGAIGFAGSPYRHNIVSPFSWHTGSSTKVSNFYQGNCKMEEFQKKRDKWKLMRINCNNFNYVPSVVLDGFAIFVRRELWQRFPFDEKLLTGFHGYDIDFTLTLSHYGYINYVCTDIETKVLHCSMGNFNKAWMDDVCELHNKKWCNWLPLYIKTDTVNPPEFDKDIQSCLLNMMKRVIKEKNIKVSQFRELYDKFSGGYRLTSSSKVKLLQKFIWYRIIRFYK